MAIPAGPFRRPRRNRLPGPFAIRNWGEGMLTSRLLVTAVLFSISAMGLAGCGDDDDNNPAAPDTTPPARVTDLAASTAGSSITLTWTAPGDDGNVGTAASYGIRYADAILTADGWDAATAVASPPAPQTAGSAETLTIDGLATQTVWYFALKAEDEAGNTSPMSNVAASDGNEPPDACFTVTPDTGTTSTLFAVDASCSSDDRTPAADLEVRWDWEGDGTWDTDWTTTKTASHQYATAGSPTIQLMVRDEVGFTDTAQSEIEVEGVVYHGCDYFPITLHNSWLYSTGSMFVNGSPHAFTDGVGLRVEMEWVFESETEATYLNCIDDAVVWLGDYNEQAVSYEDDPVAGLAAILNDSMQVGSTWTLQGEAGSDFQLDAEVLGTASVTVAAGVFPDCLKVRYTIDDGSVSYTDEIHYAAGVGPVKVERISQTGTTDGYFLAVNEVYPLAELQSATVNGVSYP
jgi:hypothetical protein